MEEFTYTSFKGADAGYWDAIDYDEDDLNRTGAGTMNDPYVYKDDIVPESGACHVFYTNGTDESILAVRTAGSKNLRRFTIAASASGQLKVGLGDDARALIVTDIVGQRETADEGSVLGANGFDFTVCLI